jgi:hypothetical protein
VPGLLLSRTPHRENPPIQVYALTGSQCLYETLDLFLSREAAEAEPREILHDEPDWKDVLRVVPIDLDDRNVSATKKGSPRSRPPQRQLALRGRQSGRISSGPAY